MQLSPKLQLRRRLICPAFRKQSLRDIVVPKLELGNEGHNEGINARVF
jgi:hypothetical protein